MLAVGEQFQHRFLLHWLATLVKSRSWLEAENPVLRHQGEHAAPVRVAAPVAVRRSNKRDRDLIREMSRLNKLLKGV